MISHRLPLLFLCSLACGSSAAKVGSPGKAAEPPRNVRPPAVAGTFYPADAQKLRRAVEGYFEDAVAPRALEPIAIVTPHAGIVFSGQIAADAFRQAAGREIDTVVILGVNHTVPGFEGVAISPAAAFRTPLGDVEVDRELARALLAECHDCTQDAGPHAREHSIEVQLPFVQHLFPKARLLPAIVGSDDLELCRRVGEAVAKVLSGRKVLLVASSDLSHYPPQRQAAEVDAKTLGLLADLDPARFRSETTAALTKGTAGLETAACGAASILVTMYAARALGATRGVVVSYANSGDTALGESNRVVGYGAVALVKAGLDLRPEPPVTLGPPSGPPDSALSVPDQQRLLAFARRTIERYLATGTAPLARGFSPRACALQGAFVTLKKKGDLRGCIGSILPDGALCRLIGRLALQAALDDPRFPPVTQAEWSDIRIDISLLSPPRPVPSAQDFVPGRDGVTLQKSGHAAVYLPQVATEMGWGREQMLDSLCEKAGLSAGCWREGAQLQTFQAQVFSEGEAH